MASQNVTSLSPGSQIELVNDVPESKRVNIRIAVLDFSRYYMLHGRGRVMAVFELDLL